MLQFYSIASEGIFYTWDNTMIHGFMGWVS